jgi:hypothetical protein
VNRAVDVVEFYATVGSKGVGLMEFFGEGAPVIGSVSSEPEHQQGRDGPQNGTQPGGESALAVHRLPPFQRFRRSDFQMVRGKPKKARFSYLAIRKLPQ